MLSSMLNETPKRQSSRMKVVKNQKLSLESLLAFLLKKIERDIEMFFFSRKKVVEDSR